MKFTKVICASLALASLSAFADEDDSLSALALQRANFSLEQAVEKVTTDYAGHITEFEIDDYKNQATYEIETINLDTEQKHKVQLSLEDGSVLEEESKSIKILGLNRLDDEELIALKELQVSNFELGSTIAALKQKYNANVVEFELESEKGISFYKFKLMGEQGAKRVLVDIKTGNVIPVMKH
jgi:uncharacterized membrane protein YkoI